MDRAVASVVLTAVLFISGCSETSVLQYQGRPATTALECKAAYEEAIRRPVQADYSSPGGMIGTAIGKGMAKGMIESHYENCLARVAGAAPAATGPASSATPTTPAVMPAARSAAGTVSAPVTTDLIPQCRKTMTGGTGYVCVSG